VIRAAAFTILFLATHACLLILFPFSLLHLILGGGLYSAGTLLTLYLLFHPRNQWLVENRSRVECDGQPCVSLTFDDGPTSLRTPGLLDILRESNVQATFFVIGKQAEQHPELLRRAVAEGHLIGNHTYSHPSLFCFLTPVRLRREIERGQETIERICGYKPRYFRSPVGLRHPLLNLYLKQANLEYVSWRIRSFDTLAKQPEAVLKRIFRRVGPGDIILLHDNAAAGVTLNVLPDLIRELSRQGFEFVTVGSHQAAPVTA
jgi:peptidoglycan-N-acetylglucosamine deacetylase